MDRLASRLDLDALASRTRAARRDIIAMSYLARVGHIPSALSMVDYLSIVFGRHVVPPRDKVVLGKPYGGQAYYAVFHQSGWIGPEWNRYGSGDAQWTYCVSRENPLVTFVDDTMGNTLAIACGIALAFSGRVYLNVSDAYFQAGSVWEAALFAGARRLSGIVMTVDNNRMQVLGETSSIVAVEPLAARLSLLGWRVAVGNGHDLADAARAVDQGFSDSSQPSAIILNTEKGHGVSFMQGRPEWHYRVLSELEYAVAMKELA